jgi:D-xylose transport system ATP-binding protein
MTAAVAERPVAEPVLSLTGITKRFGAVQALTDVHLSVMPGEVVALVGDNGAGKSTLVKVIAGVYTPDTGRITFDGRAVAPRGPSQAQALGIATVFQDLALCDNLHVVANLFLGQEHKIGPIIDEVSMEKEAWRLLRSLSAKIPSVRIPIAALANPPALVEHRDPRVAPDAERVHDEQEAAADLVGAVELGLPDLEHLGWRAEA